MNSVCDTSNGQDALFIKSDRLTTASEMETYLRTTGKHGFAGLQTSTTGFLNLLDLATAFSNDRAHARVGNDKAEQRKGRVRKEGKKKEKKRAKTYRMVTALEPGTDGLSYGSSLIRLTINP